MRHVDARQIAGWVAVGFSTLIACVWAFWGIIENFHEGWYYASPLRNVGLMFVQYLSPMLIFVALALAAVRWPRTGSGLHLLFALLVAGLFFRSRLVAPRVLIISPLVLLAALYWVGRPRPLGLACALIAGLPLLTLILCGAGPAWRVAGRVDDGNRGARLVAGNGVTLVWAPAGPGWPRDGVDWNEARRRCRYLTEDGTALAATPQDIWRLPTVEEAVRSMTRRGGNCGGVWDPTRGKSTYRIAPEKESPLWDVHSKVIYWWTDTQIDENKAYIIVYNGLVGPRRKRLRPGYLAFRAVKAPPAK